MKKHLVALSLCLSYTFLTSASIFAARSIVISTNKTNLVNDEEMIITASVSGFKEDEKIFLKGAFYFENESNYFGYTKNNDYWIKNSESSSNQREVQINTWDKNLIVKSDYLDSGFVGKGEYNFKLGYYYLTLGGNLSSVNWSENVLKINLDPPQPTVTNTPTPTEYQNQAKSISVTKILSPIKNISPSPSLKSINRIDTSTNSSNFDKIQSEIRNASVKSSIGVKDYDKAENVRVLGAEDKKDYSFVWIVSGLFFLISGFGYFVYRYVKDKNIL